MDVVKVLKERAEEIMALVEDLEEEWNKIAVALNAIEGVDLVRRGGPIRHPEEDRGPQYAEDVPEEPKPKLAPPKNLGGISPTTGKPYKRVPEAHSLREILRFMYDMDRPVKAQEVANHLGIGRTHTQRLLRTLIEAKRVKVPKAKGPTDPLHYELVPVPGNGHDKEKLIVWP